MIISVHIPKTGGSSFRYLLTKHFDQKVLLDYDDRPMSHSENKRLDMARSYDPKIDFELAQYECVHGHFLPLKYKGLLGDSTFITWLRHPVERHLSRYYHYVRKQERLNNEVLSPQAFCEKPEFQNIYAKYFTDFALDNFDFIGITERYQESLEALSTKLSIPLPVEYADKNSNAQKPLGHYYEITDEFRKYLTSLNSLDMEIYAEAVAANGLSV